MFSIITGHREIEMKVDFMLASHTISHFFGFCTKLVCHLLLQTINHGPGNLYLLRCPLFYQAGNMMINEFRELTMTDISRELLLYGSAEHGNTISKNVFDAGHRFIDKTGRL